MTVSPGWSVQTSLLTSLQTSLPTSLQTSLHLPGSGFLDTAVIPLKTVSNFNSDFSFKLGLFCTRNRASLIFLSTSVVRSPCP